MYAKGLWENPSPKVPQNQTPVLSRADMRKLLDSIDVSDVVGLRDRALIGLMVYSFARVSAVVNMKVRDYYQNGKRWWIRLHEKGGKFHEVPVHHLTEEYLDAYLQAAAIGEEKKKGAALLERRWRLFVFNDLAAIPKFFCGAPQLFYKGNNGLSKIGYLISPKMAECKPIASLSC